MIAKKNSPEIRLPNDPVIREKLIKKLEDYKQRIAGYHAREPYKAPEIIRSEHPGYCQLVYRVRLIEELLINPVVKTWNLSRDIATEFGEINSELFGNACAVVNDYLTTGGTNVTDSSGF